MKVWLRVASALFLMPAKVLFVRGADFNSYIGTVTGSAAFARCRQEIQVVQNGLLGTAFLSRVRESR